MIYAFAERMDIQDDRFSSESIVHGQRRALAEQYYFPRADQASVVVTPRTFYDPNKKIHDQGLHS
jgi:hypothetical protein